METPRKTDPATPPGKRPLKPLLVGVGLALVVAAGLGAWALRSGGAPRLNDDSATIVKFVTSEDFARLPFDKQQQYMKVLEGREDDGDLERLFEEGKLGETEYRIALQEAYLGEQLKRTEKYTALSSSARDEYIRGLLDKKQKKKSASAKSKIASPREEEDGSDVKRDDTATELRIESWPAEVRQRWMTFRAAYDAEKRARKQPAVAQTQPAQT